MNPAIVCSCTLPDCLENGCLRVRYQPSAPPPFWTEPVLPSSVPPMPITADDVRRIVREELTRATKENK